MIKLGNYVVTPTIFPDKSSQVWGIPEDILKNEDTITWQFESESELIHVLQLAKLSEYTRKDRPHLILPYLVYGRQDKQISNTTTFARQVFIDVIKPFFFTISTYDAHSHCEGVLSLPVNEAIKYALDECGASLICFPDKGAAKRDYPLFNRPVIVLDKKRNQLTGEIDGLKLIDKFENLDRLMIKELNNILIVDDLCDRGGTFMAASKLLKELGAKEVSMYTTHGIYSGGTKLIFDNGINRIFNLKGEVF